MPPIWLPPVSPGITPVPGHEDLTVGDEDDGHGVSAVGFSTPAVTLEYWQVTSRRLPSAMSGVVPCVLTWCEMTFFEGETQFMMFASVYCVIHQSCAFEPRTGCYRIVFSFLVQTCVFQDWVAPKCRLNRAALLLHPLTKFIVFVPSVHTARADSEWYHHNRWSERCSSPSWHWTDCR